MAVFKNNSSSCVSVLDDLILTSTERASENYFACCSIAPVWTWFLLEAFQCYINQNRTPEF